MCVGGGGRGRGGGGGARVSEFFYKGIYFAATCVFLTRYSTAGASYTFYPLVLVLFVCLFLGLTALLDSISVYIGPSPKEREKSERKDRGE